MTGPNILVTGCGGDISQSIAKALRGHPDYGQVYGCDIHDYHAGKFIFDRCFIVERAASAKYLSSLSELVNSLEIDFLIPATEAELRVLRNQGTREIADCKIIMANDLALDVGLDKYETAEFLSAHHITVPKTFLLESNFTPTFPCIVKGRMSSGSKSLFVAKNPDMLLAIRKLADNAVYQEYVGTEEQEFTCALFRSSTGKVRMITFRRRLAGDHSVFGEVVYDKSIESVLRKVADVTQLDGSINVQLRLTSNGPVIFEINPRFSSTVYVRHLLGFQDVVWSLQDAQRLEVSDYQPPVFGSQFFKSHQEFVTRK
jgi:carbamoyl-phosphate synthase large subunit